MPGLQERTPGGGTGGIGQLVSWLGGKATLAATVAGELGPHRKYVEVFCGSMAVLLAKLSFAASYGPSSGIGRRWRSAVMTVPKWRRRLERVTILNRDGLELLERIPDEPEIVIYLDPPYLGKSDGYVHGLDGLAHAKLAGLARGFTRARVIVSGYRDPALLAMFPGWTVRDVPIVQSLAMSAGKQETVPMAPEVLLINGRSYGAEQGLFE